MHAFLHAPTNGLLYLFKKTKVTTALSQSEQRHKYMTTTHDSACSSAHSHGSATTSGPARRGPTCAGE